MTDLLEAFDDWEDGCWALLARRYPAHELVRMPAVVRGDCGIEGFSRDGVAYQCYADEGSASIAERTRKQKKKLTTDTGKLKTYADVLPKYLGRTVIERYVFMVPAYHDKELVAHCNLRAGVVRGFGLTFIAEAFEITPVTHLSFPDELAQALAAGERHLRLPTPKLDASAVTSFSTGKPTLVAVLEEKLSAIGLAEEDLRDLRDRLLRHYLEGEQTLGHLSEWPQTWESVQALRRRRQDELETESLLTAAPPDARILQVRSELEDALLECDPALSRDDASRIAWGTTAGWLLDCPLRFRTAA